MEHIPKRDFEEIGNEGLLGVARDPSVAFKG